MLTELMNDRNGSMIDFNYYLTEMTKAMEHNKVLSLYMTLGLVFLLILVLIVILVVSLEANNSNNINITTTSNSTTITIISIITATIAGSIESEDSGGFRVPKLYAC